MKKKIVVVKSRSGKDIRLLNPAEKSNKFAYELKTGMHFTNFGDVKTDRNGKPLRLTKNQRAYRVGYLGARKDNSKCFNTINGRNNKKFMAPVVYVE